MRACRSIPLSLLTTDASGKASVDHTLLLDEREKFIAVDTSKPFKLNAGTVSVCASHALSLSSVVPVCAHLGVS